VGRIVGQAGASLVSAVSAMSLASEPGGQLKLQVHVPFVSRPHESVPELPSAQCDGGGLPHSLFSQAALVESAAVVSLLVESTTAPSVALVVVSLLLQATSEERRKPANAFIARG
jgi:hypothetical protein